MQKQPLGPPRLATPRQVAADLGRGVERGVVGVGEGVQVALGGGDGGTLVHIEKGRGRADERFWQVVDDACQAEGILITAFLELEGAKVEQEQRERERRLAVVRARADELRALPARQRPVLPVSGDRTALHLSTLGQPPAPADIDEAVSVAARTSIEFLARAEMENVGELTLEQLHSEVRRISHAYLKAPTTPLFVRTCELRDRAFALLDGHHRPSHARDLYTAAKRICDAARTFQHDTAPRNCSRDE